MRAPAQVHVVAHQRESAVEAAEFLPHVPADEHARAGDGKNGADLVVLTLVLFAPVQPGPAAPAVGDGDADLQKLLAVVPAAQLGTDDRGVRVGVDDAQQFGERVGLGRAVVVEQPQPLHGLAVGQVGHVVRLVVPGSGDGVPAARPFQIRQVVGRQHAGGADRLLDGRTEAGAAGEVDDTVRAERFGEQRGRFVGAAGVGGDDVLYGAFLADQPGEGVGEPAGTVVGDEHGGDDVPRVLRCGG